MYMEKEKSRWRIYPIFGPIILWEYHYLRCMNMQYACRACFYQNIKLMHLKGKKDFLFFFCFLTTWCTPIPRFNVRYVRYIYYCINMYVCMYVYIHSCFNIHVRHALGILNTNNFIHTHTPLHSRGLRKSLYFPLLFQNIYILRNSYFFNFREYQIITLFVN